MGYEASVKPNGVRKLRTEKTDDPFEVDACLYILILLHR